MASLDEDLLRALECAVRGALEDAQAVLARRSESVALQLAAFLAVAQGRERDRASAMGKARHDLGNALAIASASIEAMLDGVVEITEPRLNRIREILAAVSVSMYELTSEGAGEASRAGQRVAPADDPIAAEISDLTALADAKGVRLSYACAADTPPVFPSFQENGTAKSLRTILLNALRYTPPGGFIELRRSTENEVTLSVTSMAVASVLQCASGMGRLLEEHEGEAIVSIALHDSP